MSAGMATLSPARPPHPLPLLPPGLLSARAVAPWAPALCLRSWTEIPGYPLGYPL